jgi:hypothetical protein
MTHNSTLSELHQAKVSIPLARSVLCLDCDRVSEISRGGCPTCGSQTRSPLSIWLDRDATDSAPSRGSR